MQEEWRVKCLSCPFVGREGEKKERFNFGGKQRETGFEGTAVLAKKKTEAQSGIRGKSVGR